MNDRIALHDYSDQLSVAVEAQAEPHTKYAGALAYARTWQRLGLNEVLAKAGIHYGQGIDQAPEMALALSLGPLVEAESIAKVAKRFSGPVGGLERDEVLASLIPFALRQKTLDRFLTQPRHNWAAVIWQLFDHLRTQSHFTWRRHGILILDDFPLPKPYARHMEYLTPIWDNNLKMEVTGYAIVHLYYYHPQRPSYSVYMEPWLKTSLAGETLSKHKARRRARPGEERSKLDIALEAIEQIRGRGLNFEAVVMDNWYTVRWFGHALSDLQVAWIGEADSGQKFQIAGQSLTVPEIWQRYAKALRPVRGQKAGVRAYALQATLQPDQYTRQAQTVRLVLVEGLHAPRDKDEGRHLLVCNQVHWTARHVVRLFSYRPQTEARHRTCKQQEGWLAFHTRDIQGLLGHLALSLLRSAVLDFMRLWAPPLAECSLESMIDHHIRHVADLSHDPAGRLIVHLACAYPALSLIIEPLPPLIDSSYRLRYLLLKVQAALDNLRPLAYV